MPNLTPLEYNAWLAKSASKMLARGQGPAVEKESDLHNDILDECKRRGWIVFHGSMAHKSFKTLGEPDFVILADGGKTILIEAKSRTGKLSPEQAGIVAWASKLGHMIHIVRNFDDFIAATKLMNTITSE